MAHRYRSEAVIPDDQIGLVIDRLERMGMPSAAVIAESKVSELVDLWNQLEEPHPELQRPGPHRAQMTIWHRMILNDSDASSRLDLEQAAFAAQASSGKAADQNLAESLHKLAKATKRRKSDRKDLSLALPHHPRPPHLPIWPEVAHITNLLRLMQPSHL